MNRALGVVQDVEIVAIVRCEREDRGDGRSGIFGRCLRRFAGARSGLRGLALENAVERAIGIERDRRPVVRVRPDQAVRTDGHGVRPDELLTGRIAPPIDGLDPDHPFVAAPFAAPPSPRWAW